MKKSIMEQIETAIYEADGKCFEEHNEHPDITVALTWDCFHECVADRLAVAYMDPVAKTIFGYPYTKEELPSAKRYEIRILNKIDVCNHEPIAWDGCRSEIICKHCRNPIKRHPTMPRYIIDDALC